MFNVTIGDSCPIMRGMWFSESSGVPLEEDVGNKVEAEHIEKFLGYRFDNTPSTPTKGPKPGKTSRVMMQLYAYK